ncbi:phage antirepressor KilAC domain-containing protein [Bacteroides zhangwenhongii]|uniref:phage antirepressor KilAC domain-containing protein n=1 Tax=Bacteroides zhangwenhongii TaxID=2650157 RepID=UPI003AAF24D9
MNKVSIFEHPQFGQVRTVEINGKIWFCASDIASALGYSNPRDAVVRHCKPMGVVLYDTPTRSAVQKIKYINEGNVYRLIACSKLPAAEKFESWIFDELVPQTLRNGGYILGRKGETDNELLARAVLLAQGRIKERDERIGRLEQENSLALLKLKLQAPKVTYYDKVLQSGSTYTTTQIAKELGMSAGLLNKRLKWAGIQFRQSGQWLLKAPYQNLGYTATRTHVWESRTGETGTNMLTVWTEKGRLFIHYLFEAYLV